MSTSTELTVRKTIEVAVPVDHAWEVFTVRAGEWWPGRTHSIAREAWESAQITADWIGETRVDGTTESWGTVDVFEPPHRLVIGWLVNPEREAPTRLEVLFTQTDTGTRVDLTHSGFEIYEDSLEVSGNYESGWDVVLAGYVAAAEA